MISVIIPVYNMEDYLYVCLNSVLKQTYSDFEIICIDDASTDSSLEILEYFSYKDSRVKIIKNNSNKGPGYSRNEGLNIANGKYVFFLDGDDWLSLDTFEILIQKSEQDNLDLLMFNSIIYDNEKRDFKIDGYYSSSFFEKFENKIFNHFDLDKEELFNMPNNIWNNFYLKSFLDSNNIRFPNEKIIYENLSFFYKVMTSTGRISVIDNYLYNKRERQNSSIHLVDENINVIDSCYSILNTFLDNFQIYQYYKKEILNYIFRILNDFYEKIDGLFKEKFFIDTQMVYKNFIKNYGLYEDIIDNVDEVILNKFNFTEISDEILDYNPEISIIIPVYNAEKFLCRCLNSVKNQSMENIEVICINDGSCDSSLTILNSFKNRDYRINIFSQENKGAAIARNKGIEKANGDYVIFVDSDDWIEETMCEELYSHAKHLDSDLVLFNATEHNFDNEYKNRIYFPDDSFSEDYSEFIFDYKFNKKLVLNYYLVVWSKMYKKELVKNIKFPDLPLFEDVPFHVKSMLLSNKISYFPNLFYHYMKLNTMSEQNFKVKTDKSLCIVDVFKEVYVFLIETNYFDEFKINFLTFALKESKNVFEKIGNEYKPVLFENLKIFFNSLNIDLNLINELPLDLSDLFYNLINSDNYDEFQCL